MAKRYVPYAGTKGRSHLKFELDYSLGGYSYLSSGKTERGIWLYIRSVEKNSNFESYTMFGEHRDRKILVEKLLKKNTKRLDIYWSWINQHTDEEFIEYYETSQGPVAITIATVQLGLKTKLLPKL